MSERFSDIFRRNLLAAHDTEHWLAFLALLKDEFVEPVAIASAMETADCSQDTHRDATFAVLTGDENGEVMEPIAKLLKLSTPPGAFASRRGTPPSDGREIASDDEDSVSWGGSAFSNPEKDGQDAPAVCASAVLETMMESDNFESKEDVATALRCRDSVDALRKEDLANLASLIDKDTNVEKTGASRTVVLAGIRETLELVIERMHGTLTKKQIRSISFFTLSRIFKNKPTLADIIHVPRQRALLLQDALDKTLKKPLEDLVAATARIKTPSRTMNQQKENVWRERLKKVRQEIDKSSLHVRYVLHEQLLTEARAEKCRAEKELQNVVCQRWEECYTLELYTVEKEMLTKAEAIAGWLREGYSRKQSTDYFARFKECKTEKTKRIVKEESPHMLAFRDKVCRAYRAQA